MRRTFLPLFFAFSLGTAAPHLQAQAPAAKAPSPATLNLLGPGVGVEGFDPVSYWPEGGGSPTQGTLKLTFEYKGVAYRFANEKNLETFKTHPDHYLPQYGGYCAWAMGALAQRVDVNPNHFVLRDGKLYLFFSDANVTTRAVWKKTPAELVAKADANYARLLAQ